MPEIRKIAVGPDFKNAMNFFVGQNVVRERNKRSNSFGDHKEKIDRIIFKDGRYEVWLITLDGSKEVKMWRYFENMPISVEYDINY